MADLYFNGRSYVLDFDDVKLTWGSNVSSTQTASFIVRVTATATTKGKSKLHIVQNDR